MRQNYEAYPYRPFTSACARVPAQQFECLQSRSDIKVQQVRSASEEGPPCDAELSAQVGHRKVPSLKEEARHPRVSVTKTRHHFLLECYAVLFEVSAASSACLTTSLTSCDYHQPKYPMVGYFDPLHNHNRVWGHCHETPWWVVISKDTLIDLIGPNPQSYTPTLI